MNYYEFIISAKYDLSKMADYFLTDEKAFIFQKSNKLKIKIKSKEKKEYYQLLYEEAYKILEEITNRYSYIRVNIEEINNDKS